MTEEIPPELKTDTRFIELFTPFHDKEFRNSLVIYSLVIDTKHPTIRFPEFSCSFLDNLPETGKMIKELIERGQQEYSKEYTPYLGFDYNIILELNPYNPSKIKPYNLEPKEQSEIEKQVQILVNSGTLKLFRQQEIANEI